VVADSDSESGAEFSDVEEEEDEQQQEELLVQQAPAEDKLQGATSAGGLAPWGPPQGRNTNIHPSIGPAKGVKKREVLHINRTVRHCLC
jgi:hypothetical protein